MGRDRCRRGYFMANKTKNKRSSNFQKLNTSVTSERKTTFLSYHKLHDHNYTEPCTSILLDIGSEVTIGDNDVNNGWKEVDEL